MRNFLRSPLFKDVIAPLSLTVVALLILMLAGYLEAVFHIP